MIKVAVGCANVYIHYQVYITNDVWFYHKLSLIDLSELQTDPQNFLNTWLFDWGDITQHLCIWKPQDLAYWKDLGTLVHTKYMTLANIFTFGNLYTNVIFFNIVYFLGTFQLYKVFYQFQPQKKYLFAVCIFLIPSVLFWCSGIHKDGWVLASIGLSCYFGWKYLHSKSWLSLLFCFVFLFFLFISRNFVFLCFVFPFLLWLFLHNRPNKLVKFNVYYLLGLALPFLIGFVLKVDPLSYIVQKQWEFFTLRGYSDMKTPVLAPNFISFIRNLPSALDHIFLRPYIDFNAPMKYMFSAVDSFLVCCIYLISICFIKRKNTHQLFYYMLIVFAMSMYLFIGLVVPNCGALVRYKSEFTALLMPSLIALSEVPFFKRFYVTG